MVMILPADETMAKLLRHPNRTVRKFVNVKTPVEWPMDQFTIRRLAEGVIKEVKGAAPNPPTVVKGNPGKARAIRGSAAR